MLGKLVRYELKGCGRSILFLWAAAVILAVVSGLSFSQETVAGIFTFIISTVLFIAALIAMFVLVIVIMIRRFYKEMVTTEGYFMHMLPAKPWEHIISNLITALIWTVLSVIVAIGSILLMSALANIYAEFNFSDIMYEIGFGYLSPDAAGVVKYAIFMIFSAVSSIMMIYVSILAGGCANRRKGLWAFLIFIGINIVTSVLGRVLGLGKTVSFTDSSGLLLISYPAADVKDIVFDVILAFIFFFVCRDLLAKKVNLA